MKLNITDMSKTRKNNIWRFIAILLITINLSVGIVTSYVFYTHPTISDKITKRLNEYIGDLYSYVEGIPLLAKGYFSNSDNIYLDIKHIPLQQLEYQRVLGNNDYKTYVNERKYVNATIRNDEGKKVKVKMRAKGTRKIHFESLDTMSYRVSVKGDNVFFGMKKFSLHKPRSRNYVYEWLFLELMKQEGLIVPEYKFVNMFRNGKNLGIYAIEEHYTKHLVERYQRRDGPIIRFEGDSKINEDFAHYKDAYIEPYQKAKWYKDGNIEISRKAVQLLESFRRNELKVSEVFDIKKLASFFAIADIFGGHHGVNTKSLRFYYNPISSLLEPVPYDGHLGAGNDGEFVISADYGVKRASLDLKEQPFTDWYKHLFSNKSSHDNVFIKKYFETLNRIANKEFLDKFFESINDELEENIIMQYSNIPLNDKIGSFGPGIFIFNKNRFYENVKKIRELLNGAVLTAHLINELESDNLYVTLKSRNNRLPIEVISIRCGKTDIESDVLPITLVEENEFPLTHKVLLKSESANIIKDNEDGYQCLKVDYRVLGIEQAIETTDIKPWARNNRQYVLNDVLRKKANFNKFSFIEIDNERHLLKIKSGKHVIKESIIVPKGYKLVVSPNTELQLDNRSMIITKSAVEFIGEMGSEINITSSDGTGQGFVLLNADAPSIIKYTKFSDMRNPDVNGWKLTGMVNIYKSQISMDNVSFYNNKSEDALNIIRSNFKLINMKFDNISSDALDVDFGVGEITKSSFTNIGNDAIDLSGSKISVNNIIIISAQDKGISAGESSELIGHSVSISKSEIAVASKDESTVILDNLSIIDNRVALTAFQKKPEYGFATIEIGDMENVKNDIFSLIERGSSLTLNGEYLPGNVSDIESMMYGNEYGKSSK
ncbi:MAG: CotH kinase family protein [Sedimenticola sp.]